MRKSVELFSHLTVLVLSIRKSRIILIETIIVMSFGVESFLVRIIVMGRVRVVHMVKVIDFPIVAAVDMANVMMINDNISMLSSVIVIVMVDVFRLCVAEKALCCLCCMLIKQVRIDKSVMHWWDLNSIRLLALMAFLGMQSLFREVSCEALDPVSVF